MTHNRVFSKGAPAAALAIALTLAAACSANGTASNPFMKRVDLSSNKLQFSVGTANIGFDGAVGLNVVATFRQPNGHSAVLVDTPTITGPSGFVVPTSAPSSDAGTNHISGTPQVFPTPTTDTTTFATNGGVFSYGFGPFNSDNLGTAFYPGNPNSYPVADYVEPFYAKSGSAPVPLGGSPAYPFFNDGTYPIGFAGYPQGFAAFEAKPVTGTYSLSVIVPIADATPVAFAAVASLTNNTPLPPLPRPAFAKDGLGGGSATLMIPADARIVETMIYIVDADYVLPSTGNPGTVYYAIGPITGTGNIVGVLPDKIGPCIGSGCQNGSSANVSIQAGNHYQVYAISYDYPAFEAGPPGNSSQTPTITGAAGQADITISRIRSDTY
jgi:hypothetical protein